MDRQSALPPISCCIIVLYHTHKCGENCPQESGWATGMIVREQKKGMRRSLRALNLCLFPFSVFRIR